MYTILYAYVGSKRYTPAVRRLEDGDTTSNVFVEFLNILDGFDLGIEVVYLDREFYNSRCLTLFQAHDYVYITLIVRWGWAIKRELLEGWSRTIQCGLTVKLNGHSWTVEFPVYIDCAHQNGRYDEHGVACHDYIANAPFTDSP